MKFFSEQEVSKRFYFLNVAVSIALLIIIIGSIREFGQEAVEGRRIVALVLPGKVSDVGYNKDQYDGLLKAANSLDYELTVSESTGGDISSLETAASKLSKRRAKTVFFANTENLEDVALVGLSHPNLSLYGLEEEKSDAGIKKYTVRYAEAYYLAGIIAGLRTVTHKVGFIAPHPSPNINQIVNAFTLGVRRIKKDAEVCLSWTGAFNAPAFEEQAVRDMRANNADVIAYFSEGTTIPEAASRARIDFISIFFSNSSVHNLAVINVQWNRIYHELLRRETQGEYAYYTASVMNRAVNVELNQPMDPRSIAIFEAEYFEITDGRNVFTGPITDNKGYVRANANEVISSKNLDKMSYLAEGVRALGH